MVNVLSIDGGGIRGVIPARVLQELEEMAGEPVADLFDLIAGTSTGGIIALGLTLPEEGASSASLYSAEGLTELYQERGRDIFSRSLYREVMSLMGLKEEQYSHAGLVRVLEDYFGDAPMGTARTDVMVTTYDIEDRDPVFFKSWETPDEIVPMRRAARATSAAPTYFEPAEVMMGGDPHVLIDGGVFVNNPAVSAYAEARKRYPDDPIRVVSVGTGSSNQSIGYEEASGWGELGWAVKIMDVVLDGMSDAVDYQLRYILEERFDRFQVTLQAANDEMDDASSQNIDRLLEDAERLIEARADELRSLAEDLVV